MKMDEGTRGGVWRIDLNPRFGRLVSGEGTQVDLHIHPGIGTRDVAGQGSNVNTGCEIAESTADDHGRILSGIPTRDVRTRCGVEQMGAAVAFNPRCPIEQDTILHPWIADKVLAKFEPIIAPEILFNRSRVETSVDARRC